MVRSLVWSYKQTAKIGSTVVTNKTVVNFEVTWVTCGNFYFVEMNTLESIFSYQFV
jgi:hypothetical protein